MSYLACSVALLQTPGIRARPTRLQWFCERCITSNQVCVSFVMPPAPETEQLCKCPTCSRNLGDLRSQNIV